MNDDHGREKLNDLSARIKKAGGEDAPKTPDDNVSLGVGRLGFDFAATLGAMAAIGWLADREFGSKPWGLIVMLFIGFAAGIANASRSLGGYDQGIGWHKKDRK